MFVENKFDAELTPAQPVDYLRALDPRPASVLAFIAPEHRIDYLWEELKQKCDSAQLERGEESRTANRRRMRVDKRTMLVTSWRRVLDALQEAAASPPALSGTAWSTMPCGRCAGSRMS